MPRNHVPTALPQQKPLPQLPMPTGLQQPASPTLTNPDFILPSALPAIHSPPRLTRRPPSPSYLRDESPSPKSAMAKKERHHLGLMSRKMMLLRSRTASSGQVTGQSTPRAMVRPGSHHAEFVPSSPILQDVGNLAPEQPEYLQLPEADRRSASGGSSSSDISGMTGFLAKYSKPDGTSDDETLYEAGDGLAPEKFDSTTEVEDDFNAERRKQRQEEYNSAILSKRAEQILANAKKRLNVMEGNLRGARDLVAPLTAANLKRATSLGSAQYPVSHGRRYGADAHELEYEDQGQPQQSSRRLHSQASSPAMGRDYQGHSRGWSENDMPERPYTSLENPHYFKSRNVRGHARAPDFPPQRPLRGSRSHDSLGSSGVGYGTGRERPLLSRGSPSDSSQLETLQEDDERRFRNSENVEQSSNNGLGIYRPSSRTSDLREQMSNLKGKISTLKERAREESLRRRSQSNLRHSSPFNNAAAVAPEFFYTSSASYGSPVLDTNAGIGWTSETNSPVSPERIWEHTAPFTGSRNAFAEEAAAQMQHPVRQARVVDIPPQKTPDSKFQVRQTKSSYFEPPTTHRRTASGTAIVDSAKNRFSHHQRQHSQESRADTEDDDYLDVPSPGLRSHNIYSSPVSSVAPSQTDDGYAPSEDGTSVYEDAQDEQDEEQEPVVAHEDREDAFDYEHFFLHSAMGSYGNGRRDSLSSGASMSSVETAKGPAFVGDEEDDEFNSSSTAFPPPTPETPERLRDIERNLHRRTLSNDSVTTMDTFATAEEDPISPIDEPIGRLGFGEREREVVSPIESVPRPPSRSQNPTRTGSRPNSRPGTAVKRAPRRDSSSDRADSGVGLPRKSMGNSDTQRPVPSSSSSLFQKHSKARSTGSVATTPPTSPRAYTRQDPATVAVNALLDPNGKPLGLRNKAILFGVIESLRKVVHQLQEEDETHPESRALRKKLDEAKVVLDGLSSGS